MVAASVAHREGARKRPRPYLHTYLSLGQDFIAFRLQALRTTVRGSLTEETIARTSAESLMAYYASPVINHPFLLLRTFPSAFPSEYDFSHGFCRASVRLVTSNLGIQCCRGSRNP